MQLKTRSSVRPPSRGVEPIRYAIARSYLGWALVAATARGVCQLDLDDSREELRERLKAEFPEAELQNGDLKFQAVVAQAIAFLENPTKEREFPLDLRGTEFQQRVWKVLQTIPPGSTASYTEIAKQIGNPKAARAVAQACAANQVAVAIPCHRVVRGDGKLAGFRWGIERKRLLLERESPQGDRPKRSLL